MDAGFGPACACPNSGPSTRLSERTPNQYTGKSIHWYACAKTAPGGTRAARRLGMIRFSQQASLKSMVGFPLLLIPLAVYNIIVFLMPGVSMTEPLFRLTLMSGAEWAVTLSDMLLALGVVLLLLEVVKGARPGAKYFMDHLLSLVVFGG